MMILNCCWKVLLVLVSGGSEVRVSPLSDAMFIHFDGYSNFLLMGFCFAHY